MSNPPGSSLRTVTFASSAGSSRRPPVHTPATLSRAYTPRRAPATRTIGTPSGASLARRTSTDGRRISKVDRVAEENLSDLTRKTWTVYKATPLYKFSHEKADLKRYGQLLAAAVEAECKKGVAITSEDVIDSASFSIFHGLKLAADDKNAVKILLKRPKRDSAEAGVALTAILCCVGAGELAQVPHADFTPLPLLLVKGSQALTRYVTSWLMSQFDCSMSPLVLNPLYLSWMVTMWSGFVPEKRPQPVELVYTMPSEITGLSRITMDVDPRDCKVLWQSIHGDPDNDTFCEEEALAFINSLEAHFYYTFGIMLEGLHLSRIGTAVCYVGMEGKLKVFSKDHILQILNHFTQLASEQVVVLGQVNG